MEKFRTFVKEGLYAQANPQANLTKKQRQALASPAARAKPKDQVTLPKMPWDKDKKKDEAYGCSSKKKKSEATEEGIVNTLATKVAKKTRDPNTIRRLTHKAASAVANATDGKEKRCESVEVNESTNWKGGSKHIGLTRFAAKQGQGVQITQAEPMPGQQKRFKGAYVSVPIKDIPKICKALMNVYKAPANAQLGDDD